MDVSDKLAASQSSAVIRFTSDGDLYVPNALALQIDSKGANLVITKSTEILTYSVPKVKSGEKIFLQEGETSQHTVVITNNSQTQLFNMVFKDAMLGGAA